MALLVAAHGEPPGGAAAVWPDRALCAPRKDRKDSPCLVVDFLGPPLACPESVPATTNYAHRGKALENEVAPLLEVRYMSLRAADRKRVLDERQLCTMGLDDPIYKSAFDRFGWQQANRENLVHVFAASSDEIKAAREHLDRMAATYVSSSYSEHFYSASSCHHRTAKASFRCSFVVPPSESLLLPPKPRTDMLCRRSAGVPPQALGLLLAEARPELSGQGAVLDDDEPPGRTHARGEDGDGRASEHPRRRRVHRQDTGAARDDRRSSPRSWQWAVWFLSKRDSESLGQPGTAWCTTASARSRTAAGRHARRRRPHPLAHREGGPKASDGAGGLPRHQGYFKAIREGDNLRVFCKMVEPQPW